jgi:FKBP-type peptidyl-prolyl cis-trans isomerase FklB
MIRKTLRNVVAVSILATLACCNGKKESSHDLRLENATDSISYYTGIYTAWTVKDFNFDTLNTKAFNAGVFEALQKDKPAVSKADANINIKYFFERLLTTQNKKNLFEGQAYLEKNKSRKEIIVTSSGLQYEKIKAGNGIKPNQNDSLLIAFTGILIDGTEFASTRNTGPETFSLNQADDMKGWIEALKLMDIGSKYKFYVPAELGFGENSPPIKGMKTNTPLIFEIELLSVVQVKSRR